MKKFPSFFLLVFFSLLGVLPNYLVNANFFEEYFNSKIEEFNEIHSTELLELNQDVDFLHNNYDRREWISLLEIQTEPIDGKDLSNTDPPEWKFDVDIDSKHSLSKQSLLSTSATSSGSSSAASSSAASSSSLFSPQSALLGLRGALKEAQESGMDMSDLTSELLGKLGETDAISVMSAPQLTAAEEQMSSSFYSGPDKFEPKTVRSVPKQRTPKPRPSPTPTPPDVARFHHTAVLFQGDKMAIFGGFDHRWRFRNDLYLYDINEDSWNRIVGSGTYPSPRFKHSAIIRYNSIIIFGGFDGRYLNDVWEFNFDLMSWNRIRWSGNGPREREAHSAVYAGNKMIVFGGFNGRYYNDLWQFHFTRNRWEPIWPSGFIKPIQRLAHGSAFDEFLYIFGGASPYSLLSDLWKFDFDTRRWEEVHTGGSRPSTRCWTSLLSKGRMYVVGGWNGRTQTKDVWVYDKVSNRWEFQRSKSPKSLIVPRFHAHTCVLRGDSIFIHGGYTGWEVTLKSFEYDTSEKFWRQVGFIPRSMKAMSLPKIHKTYNEIAGGEYY
eukprot:c20681_g1_i2.p1 GENE.c20681_g1_i2~~c20681_g1_i2.p1  ORF type:complete len:549 (+),score=202.28 c20681_g1_i2:62-1708(+)